MCYKKKISLPMTNFNHRNPVNESSNERVRPSWYFPHEGCIPTAAIHSFLMITIFFINLDGASWCRQWCFGISNFSSVWWEIENEQLNLNTNRKPVDFGLKETNWEIETYFSLVSTFKVELPWSRVVPRALNAFDAGMETAWFSSMIRI